MGRHESALGLPDVFFKFCCSYSQSEVFHQLHNLSIMCSYGELVNNKGEQKWILVYGRRRKRVRLNEVQFPAHCHPSQPSDTEISSSDLDVPLTIPKDAEVKYSVIDGTPGLSIATNRTHTWTPIASRTQARTKNLVSRVHV